MHTLSHNDVEYKFHIKTNSKFIIIYGMLTLSFELSGLGATCMYGKLTLWRYQACCQTNIGPVSADYQYLDGDHVLFLLVFSEGLDVNDYSEVLLYYDKYVLFIFPLILLPYNF